MTELSIVDPASCPVSEDEHPSEQKDLQAAASVSSPPQPSRTADDSKLSESVGEESFLPLSQRLRLKQSTAKALSTITSMF